jgi:hypothetical protein
MKNSTGLVYGKAEPKLRHELQFFEPGRGCQTVLTRLLRRSLAVILCQTVHCDIFEVRNVLIIITR